MAVWALMMVGAGATFLVITGIFAVTVWPLVLLIAKVFDGRGVGKPSEVRPADPGPAAAARDKSAE